MSDKAKSKYIKRKYISTDTIKKRNFNKLAQQDTISKNVTVAS